MTTFLTDFTLRKNIEKKLFEISDILFNTHEQDISLFMGKIGHAIFHAYMYKYTGSSQQIDRTISIIEDVFEQLNNKGTNEIPSVVYGMTGILLGLLHLKESNFIDIESELFDSFDSIIGEYSLSALDKDFIEYLGGGALGGAFYLLKRYENENANKYLLAILDKLCERADKNHGLSTWKNYSKDINDKIIYEYDLGIPHGVPGIVIFLSKLVVLKINENKAKILLNEATNWLIQQEFPFEYTCRFSTQAYKKNSGSRLGWCYGDLSISQSILYSGNILKNDFFTNFAIKTITHSTKRTSYNDTIIRDFCICHGSAGVAHMYKNFYCETGNEAFKQASIFWYTKLINDATFTDGLAGYKFQMPQTHWVNSTGLLEGIAGIGLVLISALSPIEDKPLWDELLLLR